MSDSSKSAAVDFIEQVLKSFAAIIIMVSIVGFIVGDAAKDVSDLFSMGSAGLSYLSLLQFLAFSLVSSVIRMILYSDYFAKRIMLLWRIAIMLLLYVIMAIGWSILFNWFPIYDLLSWVRFLISIAVSFSILIAAMFIKLKIEDKKYSKLLLNYKETTKIENDKTL